MKRAVERGLDRRIDNGKSDFRDYLKDKLTIKQIADGAIRAMELKKEFAKQAESDVTSED